MKKRVWEGKKLKTKGARNSRNKAFWRKLLTYIILCIMVIFLFYLLISKIKGYEWRDFTGFKDKTIWDILELFIIPISLLLFGYYLERFQSEFNRDIAKDSQRERLLQEYYGLVSEYIYRYKIFELTEGNKILLTLEGITQSILSNLDVKRKEILIKFLSDIGIIRRIEHSEPIVRLNSIDLSDVFLPLINLKGTTIYHSKFHNGNLLGGNLSEAFLLGNEFNNSDLRQANFTKSNLNITNFENANLENAKLTGASLKGAILDNANLKGVEISNAKFVRASLKSVNLRSVWVYEIAMPRVYLSGTNLEDAIRGQVIFDEDTIWPVDFNPY